MSDTLIHACANASEFSEHLARLSAEGWHIEDVTPQPTIGVYYEISLQHMRVHGHIDDWNTEWVFQGDPEAMYVAKLIAGVMP